MQKILVTLALVSTSLFAVEPRSHGPTAEMRKFMEEHNQKLSYEFPLTDAPQASRPFAEYEKARYLLLSGDFSFNSRQAKLEMVRNLPAGVTVIILSESQNANQLTQIFSQVINPNRFRVLNIPSGASFWARDYLPVPVYSAKTSRPALVDAKYFHHFEPDQWVANFFGTTLFAHAYYYEGGNFMADAAGNCVLVDKQIPDAVFNNYYGCRTVLKLPHVAGIGHIDERLKFLSDKTVLTDTAQYVGPLENSGYEVILLPRPQTSFGTYANSLLINGTLFLPVYGESTDARAIETYENQGLRVIPLRSNELSSSGKGSIHCITMTYPEF